MSDAVKEYEALAKEWHPIPPHPHPSSVGILLMAGKAAIAELKAECKARERCGNCKHIGRTSLDDRCYSETPYEPVRHHDPCRFTPSRWEIG
jgi:hypothetical protein